MSMILDALKRADRERRQQDREVPNLDTNHGEQPLADRNRRRWRLWSGLLLFTVLVAGGVIWIQALWQPKPQLTGSRPVADPAQANSKPGVSPARQLASGQTAANAQKAAIETLYQEQEQTQVDQDPGQKLTREEITSLYRQAVNGSPEKATSGQESPAADTPASPNQASPPAASQRSTETAAVSTTPTADNQTKTDSIDAPDEPQEPALSGLPQLHTLPQSLQRNIPSINYQEHHFQPEGGSWVRLNRERKRAGDPINPDLRIESIDQEGLVLNYRGRSFRLKALNSWINM